MSVGAVATRADDPRRTLPGDALLHPVPLLGVAILVANDHLLKSLAPGLVTGKLSDVAGLVFFPLLLVAAREVASSARRRWDGPSLLTLGAAVAATGLFFAATKTTAVGERAYEVALGVAQWPVSALTNGLAGRPLHAPVAVSLVADPTDLVALGALWIPYEIGRRRVAATRETADGVVAAAPVRWYDLSIALLSVALLAGATLDGWAHTHQRLALEEVITPWHAVVYAAFALVTAVVLGPPLLARLAGRSGRGAIPAGFGPSVVGVVVFPAVGLADLAWHLGFGIEADAEALLSPTHLGLGFGAALIASGPIRAAWLRTEPARWPGFLAPLLSIVAVAGIAAFALHVASLFVDPWPRYPYALTDPTWYGPHIGVAAAVVQTVLLVIPTLLLLRRWPEPPAGTMTVLMGGTTAGLTFLHDQGVLVGAPLLGGFLADLLLLAIRPSRSTRRLAVFAALVPAAVFAAYFIVLDATGPVAWSAHLIGGTIVIAAAVGVALAALVAPRAA